MKIYGYIIEADDEKISFPCFEGSPEPDEIAAYSRFLCILCRFAEHLHFIRHVRLSQMYLGLLYSEGEGVNHDYEKAFAWMKKTAEGGHPDGAFCLAEFYEKGYGTELDLIEALNWYAVAEERGADGACEAVRRISAAISNGQDAQLRTDY